MKLFFHLKNSEQITHIPQICENFDELILEELFNVALNFVNFTQQLLSLLFWLILIATNNKS